MKIMIFVFLLLSSVSILAVPISYDIIPTNSKVCTFEIILQSSQYGITTMLCDNNEIEYRVDHFFSNSNSVLSKAINKLRTQMHNRKFIQLGQCLTSSHYEETGDHESIKIPHITCSYIRG